LSNELEGNVVSRIGKVAEHSARVYQQNNFYCALQEPYNLKTKGFKRYETIKP